MLKVLLLISLITRSNLVSNMFCFFNLATIEASWSSCHCKWAFNPNWFNKRNKTYKTNNTSREFFGKIHSGLVFALKQRRLLWAYSSFSADSIRHRSASRCYFAWRAARQAEVRQAACPPVGGVDRSQRGWLGGGCEAENSRPFLDWPRMITCFCSPSVAGLYRIASSFYFVRPQLGSFLFVYKIAIS